jgi:hypothetical protein
MGAIPENPCNVLLFGDSPPRPFVVYPPCDVLVFGGSVTPEIAIDSTLLGFFASESIVHAASYITEIGDTEISEGSTTPVFNKVYDILLGQIQAGLVSIGGQYRETLPFHLPTNLGVNIASSHDKAKDVQDAVSSSYDVAKKIDTVTVVSFYNASAVCADNAFSGWKAAIDIGVLTSHPYAYGDFLSDQAQAIFFNITDKVTLTAAISYGMGEDTSFFASEPWLTPPACADSVSVVWDSVHDDTFACSVSYETPEPTGHSYGIAWGPFSYYTLCGLVDFAPPAPCSVFKFGFDGYDLIPGICKDISFDPIGRVQKNRQYFRCQYQHKHSGRRGTGSGAQPEPPQPGIVYPIAPGVYIMMDYIFVSDLYSGRPIHPVSFTISTDRDSFLWQVSMILDNEDCLELIKPGSNSYTPIEINCNGYVWNFVIESYSSNRSYGSETWTVLGRSPSFVFDQPISDFKSYVVDEDLHGGQILDSIVQSKDIGTILPSEFRIWDTDWTSYVVSTPTNDGDATNATGFNPISNWALPANTFSVTNQTDISAIRALTDAIGAFIYTSPDGMTIHIKPHRAQPPWHWEATNGSIRWRTLIDAQFSELSQSTDRKVAYDAVMVTGEALGTDTETSFVTDGKATCVLVRHTNVGPDNAEYAPNISNRLVTNSKIGLELGRKTIYDSGFWRQHTLKMDMLCPYPNPSYGLFIPGHMVSVLDKGYAWFGEVTGVSISGATKNGTVSVSQTINVEEFKGREPGT